MKNILYQPTIKNLADRFSGTFKEILVDEKTGDVILKIHKAMSVLADDEYAKKSMWIKVPRGTIEAFGNYDEWKKAGEVNSRSEFKERWLAEFPEETAWFRVIADSYEQKYWVIVSDRNTSVILMFDPNSEVNQRIDLLHFAEPLLETVESELTQIVADIDAYNASLTEALPYNRRHGKIKRSIYNTLYPNDKIVVSDNHLAMLRDLATNPDGYSAKGRISTMTVREYLKIWRLAVEAMDEKPHDDTVSDAEFFKTKHWNGSTLLDYEMDSPEAFARWNSLSENWAYHRLDLLYRQITFVAKNDGAGWWFIVRAEAMHILNLFFKVTYALYSAGIPVNLSSSKQLVEMIDKSDYVGIQPSYKQ